MGRFKIIIIVVVVFSSLFNSCKKGTEDPGFTLRTRKARITERWTMTRGKVGLTSYATGQSPFNSNFEFSEGQGKLTETGTLIIYTLSYNLNIEFQKDGKFSMTENFDGETMKSEGKWNFSSGVGSTKNKEDVFIQLETISSGDSQDHLFNHFSTEISYTLKRLSKDELIMFANTKNYMNSTGNKGVIESEFTFKKQ